MNASKKLMATAAAMAVAGAVGLAYAQVTPVTKQNINVKPNNNLTQTQSDSALPCQPGPFNEHLPKDGKRTSNSTSGTTPDCATPVAYREVRTATPVIVQTEAPVTYQPAPVVSNTTVVTQTEPTPVYMAANNTSMSSERMPRADRN